MTELKLDLNHVLERVGAYIKSEAIRMCPIDQGNLRRSIDFRIEGNTVVLFATDPNAEAMEYGTPPEPGGIWGEQARDIQAWSKRHNANAWAIISYLEKNGIKVGTPQAPLHITSYGRDSYRPFIRPAVYQHLPEIKQIIARELSK